MTKATADDEEAWPEEVGPIKNIKEGKTKDGDSNSGRIHCRIRGYRS